MPTTTIAEAPKGGRKKRKGKPPVPPAGPQKTRKGKGEPRPLQPPKGQQGPNQGTDKVFPHEEDQKTTAKAAPHPPTKGDGEWSTVMRKGARKDRGQAGTVRAKGAPAPAKPKEDGRKQVPSKSQQRAQPPPPSKKEGKKGKKRRVPRTAAVIVTCPEGQYKEVLRLAMDQIDPASLGIEGMTARRAVTGAQVFEVGSPDHHLKADALAARREVTVGKEGVRVSRPSPNVELRIRDLCDAVTEEDVIRAVASVGGCAPDQVKIGPIRTTGRGLGTTWMRCPLAGTNQLVAARRLKVGWTAARVEALEARPLQCFK